MNRMDFQKLAAVRLRDAEILFGASGFDGAYYLAGYAVECALKACIARNTNQHDFPPDRAFVQDCYTHDYVKLLRAAGLEGHRKSESDTNPTFAAFWNTAARWQESSRYRIFSKNDASELITAIADPVHGVLRWISLHW